ncbi:hypothetical protein Q3G72_024753 [Acer saccharum]|nr:hypothetical protein Q3G72_024753 [Acer saccharum]
MSWDNKSESNLFVLTSTVKRSFEVVMLAVSQKWHVLLYGPAGSGKSELINKLALESGNQGEEQDDSDKVPNKDDKGIEMEQDFVTDTFSVSEDPSGEDDDDDDKDENAEDLNMDKDEAFADPSGLKLDEPNQNLDEDIDMDEKEATETNEEEGLEEHENDGTDTKEEVGPEKDDECAENGNSEDVNTNLVDETMEEAENKQAGGTSEKDNLNKQESEGNTEMNLMAPRKDVFAAGMPDGQAPNPESAMQPSGDS